MGSALGLLWNVINPLAMALVFTFVFTQVLPTRLTGSDNTVGFAFYLTSGLIAWSALTETLTRCAGTFLENANLIKKVIVPEEVYPAQITLSATLNLVLSYSLLAILFTLLGQNLTWTGFLVPIVVVLQQLMAFGLGLLLATLTVFFRDIPHVLNVVLQVWFWATPIVYQATIIPNQFGWVYDWNVFARYTDAYRALMVEGQLPPLRSWLGLVTISACTILAGSLVFHRQRADMRDEL
jgi:lipopolysaccharide transport system permease protein